MSVGLDQLAEIGCGDVSMAAHRETDQPAALHGIDAVNLQQALQRIAHRHAAVDREAVDQPFDAADINVIEAEALADRLNESAQRHTCDAPVEPMATAVVGTIGPDAGERRKMREWPRIPRPQEYAFGIHHAARVECRIGIVRTRRRPVFAKRHDGAVLHQVVALPGREMRQQVFRRFGIDKGIGLVCPLIDGSTARLGKPDRFRPRHPARRRRGLRSGGPVEVLIRPPGFHVLVAEDPGLAIGAIGNGTAVLRFAIGLAGIIPVEPLAAGDPGLEIVRAVDRLVAGKIIRMLTAIAPVAQRHVIVDPDKSHMRRGPKRIEMKEHVVAAIARLITEIFRPIGGVGNPGGGQNGLHFGGQRHKSRDKRKAVGGATQTGEAAQLAGNQKRIDTASGSAEFRIMQHHAAIAPAGRAGVVHRHAAGVEMRWLGIAQEVADLSRAGRCLVGRSGTARSD